MHTCTQIHTHKVQGYPSETVMLINHGNKISSKFYLAPMFRLLIFPTRFHLVKQDLHRETRAPLQHIKRPKLRKKKEGCEIRAERHWYASLRTKTHLTALGPTRFILICFLNIICLDTFTASLCTQHGGLGCLSGSRK